MIDFRETFPVVIGAVIAVILQIIIAPAIELFAAMPNFITVYCLLVVIVRPTASGPVLPFVLGFINDLCVGTPVGSSSLALVLVCFVAARAFAVLNNDTVFIPLLVMVVAAFLIELIMGLFALSFGAATGLLDALIFRALPCGLYDCVIGLLLFPPASRFLVPPSPMGSGTPAHL